MSVWITGDVHGDLQLGRLSTKGWPEGKNLTKEDYVIIAGDFGVIWKNEPDRTEQYWLKWLNEKSWTTLTIDGNHENHQRLQALPIEEKFGGKVGKVNDSVYYLRRGEIYTIHNKTFFCFGGAMSWDRADRSLNVSYWEEEVPNSEEMKYANDNLEKFQNHVDYVVTHTVPEKFTQILGHSKGHVDPTRNFLDFISEKIKFQRWFCGHMHVDKDYHISLGDFSLLWDRIIPIF